MKTLKTAILAFAATGIAAVAPAAAQSMPMMFTTTTLVNTMTVLALSQAASRRAVQEALALDPASMDDDYSVSANTPGAGDRLGPKTVLNDGEKTYIGFGSEWNHVPVQITHTANDQEIALDYETRQIPTDAGDQTVLVVALVADLNLRSGQDHIILDLSGQ